ARLDYTAGDLRTVTASGIGGGVDTVFGDDGNDIILGGIAGDFLHGNAGNDLVLGDEGEIDLVNLVLQKALSLNYTTGGVDTITGDDGNDVLVGGALGDTL